MRKGITLLALVGMLSAVMAQPAAEKLWETEAKLKVPESVVFDSTRSVLYVSNINGSPAARDGNGFITKLSMDGAIEKLEWVKGLNAPKGMAIAGDKLYVSDISEVLEIDITKSAVAQRTAAPDALFLNDVTVDRNGTVYVSDASAKNSALYRLASGRCSVWLRGPEISQPNGVRVVDMRVIVGMSQSGELYSAGLNREMRKIGKVSTGIDGIAPDGGHGFFVSDFEGRVVHMSNAYGELPLLDLRGEDRNAADIEYVPSKQLLLVPTFRGNTVAAYKVEGVE